MLTSTSSQTKIITMGLLLVGTGSTYPLGAVETWQHHLEPRFQLVFDKTNDPQSHIDIRTPLEHLENIRNVLNPPVAELANLFEVSRQAVYKWLAQDSYPESDKVERITTLSKIADALKEAGIHKAGSLLHMKNSEGQSLLDLLKARKPHERHVRALITEAQTMEAAYQRSGLPQSKAKPTNDWLSSVSIPASHEEL